MKYIEDKLTRKKIKISCITIFDEENYLGHSTSLAEFNSIKDLTERYMDYEPKEPLIKDEKIREAVRAWANVNGLVTKPIYYDADYNRFCDDEDFSITIDFYREVEGELLSGHSYYLSELCGEDEE